MKYLANNAKDDPPPSANPADFDLSGRLLAECKVMTAHAASTGRRVPDSALRTITQCENALAMREALVPQGAPAPSPVSTVPACDIGRLYRAHEQLRRVVEPATPRALDLLEAEEPSGRLMKMLGPVSFIRTLMLLALVAIVAFVGLLMALQATSSQALEPVYVATAALVGAIFATLYRVERSVSEGSFEGRHESSYWILIVLGLIAGLVLAYLVIPDTVADEAIPLQLGKPLLALLGGFAASAVYRILERLVETLETMIQGPQREEYDARERQTVAAVTAAAAEQAAEERAAIAQRLLGLHRTLDAAGVASLGDAQHQIDRLLATLLGEGVPSEPERTGLQE